MLPLTQPKWQASSWCGMSLIVKELLFSLPGKSVRRGSILGVGEHCSSVCAVINAGYLDSIGGWTKWCCGWALVAKIPGYLLNRFLRHHPKNKPVPSKVYSVHAWSQKLASILLSFPVNCCCLCCSSVWWWALTGLLACHGFSVVPRVVQSKSLSLNAKNTRRVRWQGLADFGKSGRSCFMLPRWLQGPADVQQGQKGMHCCFCCFSTPSFALWHWSMNCSLLWFALMS